MKIVFALVLLTCFQTAAKADTIDYWHVYYNNKKLQEFNFRGSDPIVIKSSQIKQGDSIAVRFFRDTPCSDCETILTVEGINDWVARIKGKGTGNALKFSLSDVLKYKRRTGKNTFQVCYSDDVNRLQAIKTVIFTIKLE